MRVRVGWPFLRWAQFKVSLAVAVSSTAAAVATVSVAAAAQMAFVRAI